MQQVTQEMASEYARIHSKASSDPGTAGDEGEEGWVNLLRDWLPPNYHVSTKGRLISAKGELSPQIDVVVLKPSYPKKLMEKKIWLADGVAAIFECKTTLKKNHIGDSFLRAKKFKSLTIKRAGTPVDELRSAPFYGLLAHSHNWKSPNSEPLKNVSSGIRSAIETANHPRDLVDIVCIADLAVWRHTQSAIYRFDWAEKEFAAFLRVKLGGDWGVTSAYPCASFQTQRQDAKFTPFGALIAEISTHLAFRDASLRDLEVYYRHAGLMGSSAGQMNFWPQSVYSDEVKAGINEGKLVNGTSWEGWSMLI